jgi:D-alanyl-D-alanine dipeptidase
MEQCMKLHARPMVLLIALLALAPSFTWPQEKAADAPKFFHIEPVHPVAELQAIALAATPPVEHGDFRPSDLVELTALDPTIKLDIRYATTRNFLGTPLYSQARAFMQRPAALALARVQNRSQMKATDCSCMTPIGRGT